MCSSLVCVVSWCVCVREFADVLTSVLSVCELYIVVPVSVLLQVCNSIVYYVVSVCVHCVGNSARSDVSDDDVI